MSDLEKMVLLAKLQKEFKSKILYQDSDGVFVMPKIFNGLLAENKKEVTNKWLKIFGADVLEKSFVEDGVKIYAYYHKGDDGFEERVA